MPRDCRLWPWEIYLEFADDPIVKDTGFSCVAPGSSLEPVGRRSGGGDRFQLSENFLMSCSEMEWNEMIVSFPSLEVFEYRWSSGLSGNLYNRSKHQRDA